MKNKIAIRREDMSKKAETRVAIVPTLASHIIREGHQLIVQPAVNPETGQVKRAFADAEYQRIGAEIKEDISEAKVIFGLKEIEVPCILPDKTYLLFSHTHKGQKKNRKMLQAFADNRATVIDYELVTDEINRRLITAFTYFAGYAGMIDSLWALGQKLKLEGIISRMLKVPQAIEKQDLALIKDMLGEIKEEIQSKGTSPHIPPIIVCFLGNGKTSQGAQEVFDCLPVITIRPEQVQDIFIYGSRHYVYKLVLDIPDMFRLKTDAPAEVVENYQKMNRRQQADFYKVNCGYFESNLAEFYPYCLVMMNCILWRPEGVRPLSRENAKIWHRKNSTLRVIGDISCDPEGGIEFSRDTWIDNPVFTYDPETQTETNPNGFHVNGISVMAVTNLPCEFPKDASVGFSHNLEPLLENIIAANYDAENMEDAGLTEAVKRAVIMWQGKLMPAYAYMEEFLTPTQVEA